jgi:hypothetical protein
MCAMKKESDFTIKYPVIESVAYILRKPRSEGSGIVPLVDGE